MAPAITPRLVFTVVEEGDDFVVRFEKVVHQRPDLLQAKFGGGVRVEHGGVIDVGFGIGERGGDHQFLHVDIGAVERGQVEGQTRRL